MVLFLPVIIVSEHSLNERSFLLQTSYAYSSHASKEKKKTSISYKYCWKKNGFTEKKSMNSDHDQMPHPNLLPKKKIGERGEQ